MPNMDGTGPIGRGLGPCGCGMRRGINRGTKSITFSKEDQKKILLEQLRNLESDRKAVETKLKELEV